MTQTQITPRVYVGTYAKYNNGSIAGEWLDLTDYSSKEDFIEACAELHSDEEDPEFMFQDWEGISDKFIGESNIKDEFFEFMEATKDMSDEEKEAFQDYIDNGNDPNEEDFRDAWQGYHKSEEDFAYQLVEDCYNLEKMMGSLASYFDYEKFTRDLFMSDYWYSSNGHVFRN